MLTALPEFSRHVRQFRHPGRGSLSGVTDCELTSGPKVYMKLKACVALLQLFISHDGGYSRGKMPAATSLSTPGF